MENQEVKGHYEIHDVTEINPDSVESILVILAEHNLLFEVSLEQKNPDSEEMTNIRPPVQFIDEADARIYYDHLVIQLQTAYSAD